MLKQLSEPNNRKFGFNGRIPCISCLGMIILLISLGGCSNKISKTHSHLLFDENPVRFQVANSNLVVTDAYVIYDTAYTKIIDHNVGYGLGRIYVANPGIMTINITKIEINFVNERIKWENITQTVSIQDISLNNPFQIHSLATNEEISIRFVLPELNQQNTTAYKITIKDENGTIWDTSEEQNIDPNDLKLEPDQPYIEFSGFPPYIRRTYGISPSVLSDNSEVKNVTYEIYTDPLNIIGSQVRKKTISSPLWRWYWNTRNDTLEGLDNGIYYMRMTVNDYAGLSSLVDNITLTIDNDYIAPIIKYIVLGKENLELGEPFAILASVEDSGSYVSDVHGVSLYYKLTTETVFSIRLMDLFMGNNWSATIPGSAIVGDLNFYIEAEDPDGNSYTSPIYSLYGEGGMTTIIEPTTTELTSDQEPPTSTSTTTSTTFEKSTSTDISMDETSITTFTTPSLITDTSDLSLMLIPLALSLFILIYRRKKRELA
ncbi:hypothetical protein CEE45_08630 [Candidatus Heimdallarchaeota archaeon B3_Heim]|nr:MAG: hypothetical protein CEE45_08630 [Candidatus Heimdallarchaeota archaeon B3_Heim]